MIDHCKILKDSKTIAVVGLSDKPYRTSYQIAHYLAGNGYRVCGVNPTIEKSGSLPVYKSLDDVPFEIDIVNVFRRSEEVVELVDQALKVKPKVLWLQSGVINDEAVEKAGLAGIIAVQDECIRVKHLECSG